MEVYVYYRVAAEKVALALQSLEVAQAAALRDWPNLRSRVMRKVSLVEAAQVDAQAPVASTEVTLMEIYTSVDARLTPRCAATVLSRMADEPPGRTSARHVEYFDTPQHADACAASSGPRS